jgi:hypothetical protein
MFWLILQGVGKEFIGASLLALSKEFQTDITTISRAFTAMMISSMLGAIICKSKYVSQTNKKFDKFCF